MQDRRGSGGGGGGGGVKMPRVKTCAGGKKKKNGTDIHIQWTHEPSGSSRKNEFFRKHANYLT